MRFALSEDQTMLRDAARDLLRGECSPERLREAWAGDGRIPGLWKTLADNGLLGVCAPESVGGLELGMVELCLVLEEAGYVALPEPLLEVAAVTVPHLGSDPRLCDVVTGERLILVAQGEPLLCADDADEILGGSLEEAVHSVDESRRLRATTGALTSLHGVVGAAAILAGLGRRMLDMAVEYASVRRQFGKPIGSFQAVQHHLVDARLALEFVGPVVTRAAWALDHPEDTDLDELPAAAHAAMAKSLASDAALLAARKALQVHGAIGYTTEYDLHLFMKRTWALAHTFGTSDAHRADLARHLTRNHA